MLHLKGDHLQSAQNRKPLCRFATGGGRILLSELSIVDDKTGTCTIPALPDTTEPGHQIGYRRLQVSLLLEESQAVFDVPPAVSSDTDYSIKVLEAPAVKAISLSHSAWRMHGTESSLDKAAVARIQAADAASTVRLTIHLADFWPFKLAS